MKRPEAGGAQNRSGRAGRPAWQRRMRLVPALLLAAGMSALTVVTVVVMLDLMSAARAYVAAESHWSRAVNAALLNLSQYAESGRPEHLQRARERLAIPLAGQRVRHALNATPPDLDIARRNLLAGGNHPDDVDRMVRLFQLIRNWPHFHEAVALWAQTDGVLDRLTSVADEMQRINTDVGPGQPLTPGRLQSIRDELDMIGTSLYRTAGEFSRAVNAGGRWLARAALVFGLLALAIVAVGIVLLFAWASRGVRRSEQRFWSSFEQAPVGMALVLRDGTLQQVNDALCRFFGRQRDALIGARLTELSDGRDRTLLKRALNELMESSRPLLGLDSRYLHDDATSVWGKLSIAPLDDETTAGDSLIAVIEDISESRSLSDELAYQASHDQLTGLANRREFERELNLLLRQSTFGGQHHALILVDIDQFKIVNDTLGHQAGDALLVRLAERLSGGLREPDLLARLDGDEFGVLLRDCSLETATEVAGRLRDAINEFHFSWEDRPVNISASLGLVAIDRKIDDAAQLMQCADLACHEAKDQGRNRLVVYSGETSESRRRQLEMRWVTRIKQAIADNQLRFHGQLIAPSGDDGWRCELLVRLEDENGLVHPAASFIDAAERFHIARAVDSWVVPRAIAEVAHHMSRLPGIEAWHINLSGQSVDSQSVLPEIIAQIRHSGIEPARLCFEITESATMHSLEQAREFFQALREMGCQVALDDFGKGLSTFDYLKQLPVDLVKIDGGFVRELAHSELDHAMVRSIHEVARIAGLRTIAESVESVELLLRLRQIGIDYMQGHAIHHPEPLDELSPSRLEIRVIPGSAPA